MSLWTPFIAQDLSGGDVAVFRSCFLLAPLGMMLLLLCWSVGLVQAAVMLRAFAMKTPDRFQRLYNVAIVVGTFIAFEVAGDFGYSLAV